MIEKLHIKNFMTFKELEIPQLKRVNLIGGMNNSGKTALLEAIRILAADGHPSVINDIVDSRNFIHRQGDNKFYMLFNREGVKNEKTSKIEINSFFIDRVYEGNYFNYFARNFQKNKRELISLNSNYGGLRDLSIFIPFMKSDNNVLEAFWTQISLTPEEDDVHQILRETIEPKLVRLDVGREMVKIRLKGMREPVPLTTLGDGIQRILHIALALANAKGKIILIDEIEVGLHHSVMEKLWRIIFEYAKKWNIQIFATTHSQDCLKTFYYISSEEEYKKEAQFIRLQIGRTGQNEAILFSEEELDLPIELNMEIR